MNDEIYDEKRSASYTGFSISALRQSRMLGRRAKSIEGPPYIKIGRSIRYRKSDLDSWLERHRIQPHTKTPTQLKEA